MNFDFNSIGKALFEAHYKLSKIDIPLRKLHSLKEDSYANFSDSAMHLLYTQDFNKKDYVRCLKDLLIECYIHNIDLNKWFNIELKNEDNNTTNKRTEGQTD